MKHAEELIDLGRASAETKGPDPVGKTDFPDIGWTLPASGLQQD